MNLSPLAVAERKRSKRVLIRKILKVDNATDTYVIHFDEGDMMDLDKSHNVTPLVGQLANLYILLGFGIVGLDLDGVPIFYKSEEVREEEERREKEKKKAEFYGKLNDPNSFFNKTLASFPKVFQQRFERFFQNGIDFWNFADYELTACAAAVRIAEHYKTADGVDRFDAAKEKLKVKILSRDLLNSISLNQLDFALALAKRYIHNPESVPNFPGAMTPLSGSAPYFGK